MFRKLTAAARVYTPHASAPGVSLSDSMTASSGCTGSVAIQMTPPPLLSGTSPASKHLSRYGCLMVRIRRMPFLAAATSAGARSFMSKRKSETSCILPVALSSFLPECSFQHDLPAKLFTSSPVSKGSVGPPATALATAPAAAPAAEASMLEKLILAALRGHALLEFGGDVNLVTRMLHLISQLIHILAGGG